MLNFSQHEELTEGLQLLNEKEIVIANGANYGQIVFLVGGAGSGKGYAKSHFMQGNKFKNRDVDEWKKAFLRIAAMKDKYPELKALDLRVPDDVTTLHMWVKEKGIKDKTLELLLVNARRGILPNIIFDITFKDKSDIYNLLPVLKEVGYEPKGIHIVWVLTNYSIAVKQNSKRDRVVRDDIMLDTHSGASNNMFQMLRSGTPNEIDGAVHIILGGAKHTVFYKDANGMDIDGGPDQTGRVVIKDFKYLTLKLPGKKMTTDAGLKDQAYQWIIDNAPKNFGKGAYSNKGIFQASAEVKEAYQDEKEFLPPRIYCDMDQVLCAFLKGTEDALGKSYADKEYWNSPEAGNKKEELAKAAPNLFRDLDWMPDGKKLYDFIRKHDLHILSAYPTWMKDGKKDKMTWLNRHTRIAKNNINLVQRADKRKFAVDERGHPAVLIDDHIKNIKEWRAAGGIGIHHTSTATTIAKLKKMGF